MEQANKTKKKRRQSNMESKGFIGAVVLGIAMVFGVIAALLCVERVPVGYEGVVYTMNGVQDTTLKQGWHIVSPSKHIKMFTVGNEQLILTKDSREGSSEDESFKVTTSDNASIAVSFQMSYRYNDENLVNTYKKFKGMDGEEIVEKRVRTVLKSRISEITTDYSLMDIYSGNRAEINDKITKYLADKFLDDYGLIVLDASIIDVHPSKELQTSINNRVTALQQAEEAKAKQQTAKVEAETALIEAQKDADVKVTQAEADAKATKIAADAEAEANKKLAASISDTLVDYKTAEARLEHGWITTTGSDVVTVKE